MEVCKLRLLNRFLGLAYCGHLRTIRNHLSCLVDSKAVVEEASGPVNEDFWKMCRDLKSVGDIVHCYSCSFLLSFAINGLSKSANKLGEDGEGILVENLPIWYQWK